MKQNLPEEGLQAPLFSAYPALKLAMARANEEILGLKGVLGIGLGRKYSESTGKTSQPCRRTGGYCLSVFVQNKVQSPQDRLPAYLQVQVPGEKTATRVFLDVVDSSGFQLQYNLEGSPEPTVQNPRMGFRFTCGHAAAYAQTGTYPAGNFNISTIGAVFYLEGVEDSTFVVSAGHGFESPMLNFQLSRGQYALPRDIDRGVGYEARYWSKTPFSSFRPRELTIPGANNVLTDLASCQAMAPALPHAIERFEGRIANFDDEFKAISKDGISGFILVERNNTTRRIPVDLLAESANKYLAPVYQNTYPFYYDFCYVSVTNTHRTEPGDSGAPIFIEASDNSGELKLLGFHVAGTDPKLENIVRKSWAMSAYRFFKQNFVTADFNRIRFF